MQCKDRATNGSGVAPAARAQVEQELACLQVGVVCSQVPDDDVCQRNGRYACFRIGLGEIGMWDCD